MLTTPSSRIRRLSLAACAVALAATAGTSAAVPDEARTDDEASVLEDIQKYCTASWKNAGIDAQDWSDCTQQTMLFLLERVPRERLGRVMTGEVTAERRELHRAIWRTAQRWRRAPAHFGWEDFDRCDFHCPPQQAAAAEDLDAIWTLATRSLSPRQQRILQLSSAGWSIGEIAQQLDLSPARASDEKYKAIRKLREQLATTA